MSCIIFALPQAAFGLDCSKAGAADEKAVCADPAANAADEAMIGAYRALAAALSTRERNTLFRSQRRWLKARMYVCGAEPPSSLSECLRKEIERRRLFLEGRPETGPGTGRKLTPVIVEQTGGKTHYDLDIAMLKFVDPILPGERLFNAQIDNLLKEAPSVKPGEARANIIYSYQLGLRLVYASPKFLSAHLQYYDFSGGAHGASGVKNINIDMEKGKLLAFADVFGAEAQKPLEANCLRQIEAQKATKLPDEKLDAAAKNALAEAISVSLGKLERWDFSAKRAEVAFDPYELGAYVEGSYKCAFPAELLRPLYKRPSIIP
jgi:uncharacterized protein YecT (DUF1311 family)